MSTFLIIVIAKTTGIFYSKQKRLKIVDLNSFYSDDDEFYLNADELCAGLPHNSRQRKNLKNNYVTAPGKDACQGDSGGPLICSINKRAVLMGMASHGSGCGEDGKPGIYAKVDYFNKWFKSGLT